ncbi:CopK family periplasmic copper-binding protein [Aquabacterium sp.]|uniref:CopK family periplasmic copper-binding protein n=1 Tax=Aquabacterium sp. TaxID=1872578 RepID=UPI004037623A
MKNVSSMFALVVLVGLAAPAIAADAAKAQAAATHQLKDGGTLYIFKDGKMAKENKYGNAVYLKKGETQETVDGQKLVANSNEVARLRDLIGVGHLD